MANMVVVYPFEGYDIHSDEIRKSNRYATLEWIKRHNVTAAGRGFAVSEDDLDDGLSPPGYKPQSPV